MSVSHTTLIYGIYGGLYNFSFYLYSTVSNTKLKMTQFHPILKRIHGESFRLNLFNFFKEINMIR